MHFVHLAQRQVAQHSGQVHLGDGRVWRGGVWQVDHRGPAALQRSLAPSMLRGRVDQYRALGRKQGCIGRSLQVAVHHHQRRLAGSVDAAHIQARLVLEHRADTGQHRAGAGAPGVAVGARRFASNPLALAIGQGGHAVHRGSCFQAHPGRAAQHAAEKPDVEFPRRRCPDTQSRVSAVVGNLHRHTGRAQPRKALPRHQRIGVGQSGYHVGNAGVDQSVTTWPGASVVGAGLQCDVGGGADCGLVP